MTDNSEITKQADTIFDKKLAISMLSSSEPFPVDFDAAWKWLGYARKDNAKKQLSKFKEGVEFSVELRKNSQCGRSSENIKLSVECFKHLAMLAQTDKGWEVRNYFIECERIAKSKLFSESRVKSLLSALSPIDSKIESAKQEEEKIITEMDVLWKQMKILQKRYKDIQIRNSELWIEKHQDIINDYQKHRAIVDQSGLSNDDGITIDAGYWELDQE
ncbi:MAG: hypothetical protein V7L26_30035 [Nostoc sp.]|uniref:hypothetical protein n=1 Tax=Nostoc sp. TaxID=1180 RepID=UPI002FF78FC8